MTPGCLTLCCSRRASREEGSLASELRALGRLQVGCFVFACAAAGVACERPGASPPAGADFHTALDTLRRSPDEFLGWGFAVPTGPALVVRARQAGPDFTVYDVVRRADSATADAPALLSLYAGNYPQFAGDGLPPSHVAGLPARDRRTVDSLGHVSRDVLLELPAGTETPARVHAWYSALTPAEAARADSVLSRIRPTAVAP